MRGLLGDTGSRLATLLVLLAFLSQFTGPKPAVAESRSLSAGSNSG